MFKMIILLHLYLHFTSTFSKNFPTRQHVKWQKKKNVNVEWSCIIVSTRWILNEKKIISRITSEKEEKKVAKDRGNEKMRKKYFHTFHLVKIGIKLNSISLSQLNSIQSIVCMLYNPSTAVLKTFISWRE